MLETTAPILPARDFDETAAFYAAIGFAETGRWDDMGYLIIVMDKVELHFFGHPDVVPHQSQAGAYIRTTDVDALSDRIAKLDLPSEGIPRFHRAEDKPWGMRELAVIDPNGTLLRIGQYMQDG